ncbi:MAG: phospholipase D-like domain-containing protein, partial [Wenzhouxiangella sp.]
YILDNDDIGERFVRALAAAADRGVAVRVLIDGFGEWYSIPRASRRLRRAGVRVARFLPPRILPPSLSLNMRNHHKILVADNRIGFTGGMNIGDRHCVEKSGNRHPTRDIHFRLEGPVVAQLSREFARTWEFTTGESIEPIGTPRPDAGQLTCRTVTDGPNEDLDRLSMLLTSAISAARRSIHIMTPYFLPPREIVGALQAAALRGVDVCIVLPEENNLPYVHWATRNMLWELLFHDIRIFYQPPPFNHGKLFAIDGYYSLIGSTNWDSRSLRLNFELQVEVYGERFAEETADCIERAAAAGRSVTLEEVDGRGLPERFRDSLCWLFSPYL